MLDKKQLIFKPTFEEEEYLSKSGKLDSWTKTVRSWMNRDKKNDKKEILLKIQNCLIMIVLGIMIFIFTYFIPVTSLNNVYLIMGFWILSFVCVCIGSALLVLELIYGRR